MGMEQRESKEVAGDGGAALTAVLRVLAARLSAQEAEIARLTEVIRDNEDGAVAVASHLVEARAEIARLREALGCIVNSNAGTHADFNHRARSIARAALTPERPA